MIRYDIPSDPLVGHVKSSAHPDLENSMYAAVYHCTSIHISQWLKINYGQRFYQICMIHELKFSSDTMFSDANGKNSMFFGNGCLKWPRCPKKH